MDQAGQSRRYFRASPSHQSFLLGLHLTQPLRRTVWQESVIWRVLTAVWAVMCVQPMILAPCNGGLSLSARLRSAMSPGISETTKFYHQEISHNPQHIITESSVICYHYKRHSFSYNANWHNVLKMQQHHCVTSNKQFIVF